MNCDCIHGLNVPEDPPLPPWEKKVQDFIVYLDNQYSVTRWLRFLDDVTLFGPKKALVYLWHHVVSAVTFSEFRCSLASGWDYFKMGFKTRDFDSAYALEEFVWKLGRIRRHLTKHNLFVGVEDQCAKIKRVEEIITRVLADDYVDEFMAPIDAKYGKKEYTWDESELDDKGRRTTRMLSTRSKETPRNKGAIRRLEHAAYLAADAKKEKEWKEALKIIEKNIFSWWD